MWVSTLLFLYRRITSLKNYITNHWHYVCQPRDCVLPHNSKHQEDDKKYDMCLILFLLNFVMFGNAMKYSTEYCVNIIISSKI